MLLLTSTLESLFQLLVVLFVFVIVLVLTYYTTRWIGGYQKAQSRTSNLAIVETLRITQNKYVQLIRAGEDRYFLIAIGKDEITPLGQLSAEDLKPVIVDDEIPTVKGDFQDLMDKLLKKSKQENSNNNE